MSKGLVVDIDDRGSSSDQLGLDAFLTSRQEPSKESDVKISFRNSWHGTYLGPYASVTISLTMYSSTPSNDISEQIMLNRLSTSRGSVIQPFSKGPMRISIHLMLSKHRFDLASSTHLAFALKLLEPAYVSR